MDLQTFDLLFERGPCREKDGNSDHRAQLRLRVGRLDLSRAELLDQFEVLVLAQQGLGKQQVGFRVGLFRSEDSARLPSRSTIAMAGLPQLRTCARRKIESTISSPICPKPTTHTLGAAAETSWNVSSGCRRSRRRVEI